MSRPAAGRLLSATATPLASIFGSGFLVIVPVLAGAVGPWAVLAMAGVCALAYAVGEVIRHNIVHAEPALEAGTEPLLPRSIDRCADLALALAYVISVCLYLHIMSAFVLRGLNIDAPVAEDALTSAAIALIVLIGVVRGLKGLAATEGLALALTLAIIAALLAGYALHDGALLAQGALALPDMPERGAWAVATVLGGTLIVVQGFETPRYLGAVYDAPTRIAASRLSQIVSTAVYLVFVALTLPIVPALNGRYDDDSLIALTAIAAPVLVTPLVVAAALSQFSAAVADTFSTIGNIGEVTSGRIEPRGGYLLVGGGALALTWSADTYELLALASRAFAFYYMLQCAVAMTVTDSPRRRAFFAAVGAALAFITLFAVPAG